MSNKFNQAIQEVQESIKSQQESLVYQAFLLGKFQERLLALDGKLSEDVDINLYGCSYWVTISHREDLTVLMTLAPQWTKSEDTAGVDYAATIDGVSIHIKTRGDALPPTCRVVEREVVIPEQRVMRKIVECDFAKDAEVVSIESVT